MPRTARRTPLSRALAGRAATLVAAVVVVPASLVGTSSSAAAPTADREARSARWLAGQLRDGLLPDPRFDTYDVAAAAALSLQDSGGQRAAVRSVRVALERDVDDWFEPAGRGVTDDRAVALALVVAQEVPGTSSTDFGGRDLVPLLEGLVDDTGISDGRVRDSDRDRSTFVTDQSSAARALRVAGSSEAAAATRYLLDQQCGTTGFRPYAPKTEPRRDCDDAADTDLALPDVETTLRVVLDLQAAPGGRAAAGATDAALDWVARQQVDRGRIGPDTAGRTSVLTGLAARAFAADGRCGRARGAALWLRGVQLPSGAVPGNTAERAAILDGGFDRRTRTYARQATIDAGPALALLDPGACRR